MNATPIDIALVAIGTHRLLLLQLPSANFLLILFARIFPFCCLKDFFLCTYNDVIFPAEPDVITSGVSLEYLLLYEYNSWFPLTCAFEVCFFRASLN